jgi:hypothetical protein
MRRTLVLMLVALFVSIGFAGGTAAGQETQGKKEKVAVEKQLIWRGTIVRFDKEASTLTIRSKGVERVVHYADSTRWTQGTKHIDVSQFKEGADVVCRGKADEKGEFHANRVDLKRLP